MPDSLIEKMDTSSPSALAADEVVTLMVKHRIKQGQEVQYEAWLRRTVSIAARHPGHLGVDVIRSKSAGLHLFTCVLRYRSIETLQSWLDSAQRRQLVEEAAPMLADGDITQIERHHEFWFVPPTDTPPPPRWKQAVLTFCVICPLTLLIPLLWQPILNLHALLSNYVISTALITVTIVLLVVYLLMPFASRLAAPWLNGSR